MNSLQDQLLKSGLVNEKQVKSAKKDKRKQDKVNRKSKQPVIDETKLAAQKSQQEKIERDKALNAEREAKKAREALEKQILELVEKNKKTQRDGEIAYHFKDGLKVKKMYVSEDIQRQLVNGLLAVVSVKEDSYELVPAAIAEKIAERDASKVINQNQIDDPEDDPYADYQVPDDLMW